MHLVHCLKHGGWTVCCHLWLLRARDLPSWIYEITEIYITKKLQKLQLLQGKLYYKEQIEDGTDRDRLVVKRSEADRIFLECHLTAGGHRGRDATVGKVKQRYYWPNFYK